MNINDNDWIPYQWTINADPCEFCNKSQFTQKSSSKDLKDAIEQMIKSIKQHKGKYCEGANQKRLFNINVNIKWNSNSPYAYKSTWETHKIYV